MAIKVEFKRGDGITHYFIIPTANWSAGGSLQFTAKAVIDHDAADAAAVINQTFTDSVAVNDGTNVTYTCYFPPASTDGIDTGTSKLKKYLGEFQWVSAGGVPSTFPGDDKFFEVIVYADVRRSIS